MRQAQLANLYTACLYFVIGYLDAHNSATPGWSSLFIGLGIVIAWRFTAAVFFKPKYKSSTGV